MTTPLQRSIESLSFEEAMAELEQIVRDMEQGKTGLEQAITAYERGAALRVHCQKRLDEAQMRISNITQNTDGSLSTTDESLPPS